MKDLIDRKELLANLRERVTCVKDFCSKNCSCSSCHDKIVNYDDLEYVINSIDSYESKHEVNIIKL